VSAKKTSGCRLDAAGWEGQAVAWIWGMGLM